MYEYLEEHAYISKNKKSNYQFELTRERAECIANKYNSLCDEKDKEIERLNNIINELEKILDENIELTYVHNGKRQFNKTFNAGGLLFRDYIKEKLQELKGSDKE